MLQSRIAANSPELWMSKIIYNQALTDIEDICLAIHNKPLEHFGLTSQPSEDMNITNSNVPR